MKKVEYIKCPRCELNYIQKKDKYCDVCKQEMKAGAIDDYDLDELEEGVELCPICKVNYLNDGETICAYCQEEKQAFDKDDNQDDWRNHIDKSADTSDEDEDMDLLPVENDEIDEELDSAFSKDLDEDFADDLDDEDEDSEYSDELDDFDDDGDIDDFDEDDEDDDEDNDANSDEDDEY